MYAYFLRVNTQLKQMSFLLSETVTSKDIRLFIPINAYKLLLGSALDPH